MSVDTIWHYPDSIPVTVSDVLGYETTLGFSPVGKVEIVEKYEGARLILSLVGKYHTLRSRCFPKGTLYIWQEKLL